MIFRNSLAVSAAMLSGYVFSFVLAPIMLARLGLAQFGVWAVTGAFATYAGLMDLGVTRALGRFVALYDTQGNRRAVEQLFGLGLVVVCVVAALSAAVSLAVAPFAASALGDVLTASEMRSLLLAAVAIFSLNLLRSVIRSVPEGMQQMVPIQVAEVANNTINFTFSVIALALTRDVVVYAYANAAASLVALGPSVYAARRVWSPVRARVPQRGLVREVLGFSVKSQLSWIGDLVNNQTDKIIIAVFLDVRLAGAYEIANRVVVAVKSVAVLSVSAMVPAATSRIESEGRAIIGHFYRRYTARSLAVALPLMTFCCVSAPALMTAWLGDVPQHAIEIFVLLTAANAVNLTTGVAFSISLGEGKAGMIAAVSGITVGLNVLFTVALTPLFGLWGVIAGTMIAIVGGCTIFLVHFHRSHGIPRADYARAAGIPAAAALGAGAPIVVTLALAGFEQLERWPALVASAAFLLVYVTAYWPIATRLDILPTRLSLHAFRRAPVSRT
jgi:O-antigen/teichoic acid export membrane protein